MHARTDIGVAQYKSEPLTDGVHSASEGAPHHFWIQSAPFNNIVLVLRHVAKVKKKKSVSTRPRDVEDSVVRRGLELPK